VFVRAREKHRNVTRACFPEATERCPVTQNRQQTQPKQENPRLARRAAFSRGFESPQVPPFQHANYYLVIGSGPWPASIPNETPGQGGHDRGGEEEPSAIRAAAPPWDRCFANSAYLKIGVPFDSKQTSPSLTIPPHHSILFSCCRIRSREAARSPYSVCPVSCNLNLIGGLTSVARLYEALWRPRSRDGPPPVTFYLAPRID
jgi:hypothetical protein